MKKTEGVKETDFVVFINHAEVNDCYLIESIHAESSLAENRRGELARSGRSLLLVYKVADFLKSTFGTKGDSIDNLSKARKWIEANLVQ